MDFQFASVHGAKILQVLIIAWREENWDIRKITNGWVGCMDIGIRFQVVTLRMANSHHANVR